jgi:hypothetical protein
VRRRAAIIGILAILIAVASSSPVYRNCAESLRSFRSSFGELRQERSMNPVERFVFSVVLAHSKSPARTPSIPTPAGRS